MTLIFSTQHDSLKDGSRHGQGVLTFADGLSFTGAFENGRPLPGGVCKWPDGVSTPLVVQPEFAKFIGPTSNPVGWEVCRYVLVW